MVRFAPAMLASALLVMAFAAPPAQADPILTAQCVFQRLLVFPTPNGIAGCTKGSEGFIVIFGSDMFSGQGAPPLMMLAGVPAGWTCTSQSAPVLPGDQLSSSNPEVTCSPPAGALPPTCNSVGAQASLHLGAGTVSVTSSCGTLSATSTAAPAPAPNPYQRSLGTDAFPLKCAVDNSQATGDHVWIAWCDANLP